MSLNEYHAKRNFRQTPEPSGQPKGGSTSLIFVVQRHQASHLHFDFRLELNGVLKSWAIPKGPSLNPTHRRLAVQVEDHPLEYAKFEGTIPEGQYGAGNVEIWDHGTYTPYDTKGKIEDEKVLEAQLSEGHLTIILQGDRLKGEFALVRIKQSQNWLLIKKNDKYARDFDIADSLKLDLTPVKSSKSKDRMPHAVKPMLATLVEAPFDREGWYFEVKWDGYRAISEIENGEIKLYSRNSLSFNEKFPEIVSELQALNVKSAVLDGEIVVVGENGLPSFQLMQDYAKQKQGNLSYVVFDILYLNGKDLQSEPLKLRKSILKELLPTNSTALSFCDYVETEGKKYFEVVKQKGLEGIVAKDPLSHYRQGERGLEWQKIKTRLQQEVVIGGFTRPRGSRTRFGSLVVGVYEAGSLKFVGHVGGGFDDRKIEETYQKLEPLITSRCPFTEPPVTNEAATWIKPKLVCEVDFAEWTKEGSMRQPIFLGLREDKEPKEVKREVAEAKGSFSKEATVVDDKTQIQIGTRELTVTHPNKIFWPKERYTKLDLVNYYRAISPFLLPYLKDRPESLLRYPDGITGKSFYHKDVGDLTPDWLKTVPIRDETDGKTIHYCIAQDEASLAFLVNLGCIDFNPWNSRIKTEDKPDFAIIDLDPESTSFANVVKTALAIHEVLELAGVTGYCKTSGASGMHVYIPLGAKYSYTQAREFCQVISVLVYQKLPEVTSLERSPEKRQGKVYLDCFQNARGQTLASVYSVRPKPGAPVSTPLSWEELNEKIKPTDYNLENTFKRIEKVGDLFRPVLGKGIDMTKALGKLA